MTDIYHFVDGKLYQDPDEDIRAYQESLERTLEYLSLPYLRIGQDPISVPEAISKLASSDLIMVLGKTWCGFFDVVEPWFLPDKFLCEELFGPRPGHKVDLQDFIAGGSLLAEQEGCRFFEFGTRANSRPLALARLCSQYDARVAAITLQKEI